MSEWDKLWENHKVADHGYVVHAEWVLQVKAEGDRMQKEGLEHHAIAVEYYEKLEAIRNLMVKWEEDLKTYPSTMTGIHSMTVLKLCRKEVLEVLGE